MSTSPQRPSDHYRDAVRLLAAAESAGTDANVATIAALCAIASALLAGAPRRARRDAGRHGHAQHGGTLTDRWIAGDDE